MPARALVRAAAGCPQDASTQTELEDLVDAETEQLVGPTSEGRATRRVVPALKQQSALTAEFSKSTAQEAVKAHIDDVLSRVECLELVVGPTLEGVNLAESVSALKQQCASTAEISRSAAHEAVHAFVQPVLSRVETLEHFVGPPLAGKTESGLSRARTQATECPDRQRSAKVLLMRTCPKPSCGAFGAVCRSSHAC